MISTAEIASSNLVATAVACLSATALMRFRNEANPLIKATWLNARNDVVATVLTAALSLFAHMAPVRWPEHAIDLIGVIFSFQAAVAVLRATILVRPAVDGLTERHLSAKLENCHANHKK